jgi:hypothetical protein
MIYHFGTYKEKFVLINVHLHNQLAIASTRYVRDVHIINQCTTLQLKNVRLVHSSFHIGIS